MNKRFLFSIPDFSPKEIISYFSELNIEISLNEIFKPSNISTLRIFESIIKVFLISNSTITIESQHILDIVQKMSGFLMRIGIMNFTMKDLSPDSKRLIQILSTIINFGMYRDSKQYVYEQISSIADNNYKEKVILEKTFSDLKINLLNLNDELIEDKKKREIIEKEILELEIELKKFYKHQKDKISEVSLLKNEKMELNDKLSSCQLLEHNLKEEITCLTSQIVSDPTKLLELVDEMKQLINKEKRGMKGMEELIKERTKKNIYFTKKTEILERINEICIEINETNLKIEKYAHSANLLENKLKNCDSGINAIKIRINHIERQISHLEGKLVNLQNKDKKCSEEISSKIKNLRIKYDAVSEERNEMEDKIQKNNRLVKDLMCEKSKIYGEFEKECSEIISELIYMSGESESYFSEINNCF